MRSKAQMKGCQTLGSVQTPQSNSAGLPCFKQRCIINHTCMCCAGGAASPAVQLQSTRRFTCDCASEHALSVCGYHARACDPLCGLQAGACWSFFVSVPVFTEGWWHEEGSMHVSLTSVGLAQPHASVHLLSFHTCTRFYLHSISSQHAC